MDKRIGEAGSSSPRKREGSPIDHAAGKTQPGILRETIKGEMISKVESYKEICTSIEKTYKKLPQDAKDKMHNAGIDLKNSIITH